MQDDFSAVAYMHEYFTFVLVLDDAGGSCCAGHEFHRTVLQKLKDITPTPLLGELWSAAARDKVMVLMRRGHSSSCIAEND